MVNPACSAADASSQTVTADVTTWYLELRQPQDLRGRPAPLADLAVLRAEAPSPEFGRFLYTAVGGDWYWSDRLAWDDACWQQRLSKPGVETWVVYQAGTPAGYFELEAPGDGSVEIAYFGLLPAFIGNGIGGYLLTVAVQRAWTLGASRVWLHTCSLDGPHALANYQARGFRIYHQETAPRTLLVPVPAPGPWSSD
ncbi:MAG TPA: GNAT family N-acetyltransferase [Chloroflexota bacterium]|jgi:GNAT superfamily N-acetyltransferase|nr:GNAT family N-acetyltransferase [Chloroflexota bacterium]